MISQLCHPLKSQVKYPALYLSLNKTQPVLTVHVVAIYLPRSQTHDYAVIVCYHFTCSILIFLIRFKFSQG